MMSETENNALSPETAAPEPSEATPDFVNPFAKIPADWQKHDSVFAVLTLACSVLLVHLSLFGGFRAGFPLSYLLLLCLTVSYMAKVPHQRNALALFAAVASLAASGVFALYNDGLTNVLLFGGTGILYGVFLSYSFSKSTGRNPILRALNSVLVSAFQYIAEPFYAYNAYRKAGDKRGPNRQVLLGLALSVPVLIVVLPLLISSDAAFEGLISTVFSRIGTLILKIILGTALAIFLFSLLFAAKNDFAEKAPKFESAASSSFSPVTIATLLCVLSVIYTVYLLSQLAYFFSAFSGILPAGYSFTLADYARRGFFEICAVCGINTLIILIISHFTARDAKDRIPLPARLFATLICLFSMVFTATALSKMFLYIRSFDLTRLRLLTSIFMIMLLVLNLMLLIYLQNRKFPLIKVCLVFFTVVALAVGYCDIDRTIAAYNVTRYQNGYARNFDVSYLGTLSDSAVPYLITLTDDKNPKVREEAYHQLYYRAHRLEILDEGDQKTKEKGFSLSHYNYTRHRAETLIRKNLKTILAHAPCSEEDPAMIYY